MPTAKPGELTCKTCGLPLDPILAQIGRHILCLPRSQADKCLA